MAICQKTRLFVEKKEGFRVEALELLHELNRNLHLNLSSLRLINIYDLFNIDSELLEKSKRQVFSEPVTDTLLIGLIIKIIAALQLNFRMDILTNVQIVRCNVWD